MSYTNNFQELLNDIRVNSYRLAAVVVHINDTYTIERRGKELPGFPRFIATMRKLRSHVKRHTGSDRLLVVHAGDFIAPSRLAKHDKGAAMIEMLNRAGVDYCTLGNHEFDFKESELVDRLRSANMKVLLSNVTNPSAIQSLSLALWPSAGEPQVALTGIVSKTVHKAFPDGWTYRSFAKTLKEFVARTREVPFRICLSHATRDEDKQIREELVDCKRVLVFGGHDHDISWYETGRYTATFKNLANLQTVWVVMLLYGGGRILDTLQNHYYEMRKKGRGRLADTPENFKTLMDHIPAADAAVLRGWIRKKWRTPGKGVEATYFTEGDPVLDDELAGRLGDLPSASDYIERTLTFRDFLKGSPRDDSWVNAQLARLKVPNEGKVVRDFSRETDGLEARDTYLRGVPTDFGIWAAECVRRHARADIAILNSGSFRCDARLPNILRGYHLEEAFLYDDMKSPVIVLHLQPEEVDTLIEHGLSRKGEGAFPQLAGVRKAEPDSSLVAISSYVLTNAKSLDGYAEVLARKRGITEAALRASLIGKLANGTSFTIKQAVRAEGANVDYVPGGQLLIADASVQFVDLTNRAIAAFNLTEKRKHGGPPRRLRVLCEVLSKRRPAMNRELEAARDALREFIETTAFNQRRKGPTAAMRALRKDVENSRLRFEHHVDYANLFDHAADGIFGWEK